MAVNQVLTTVGNIGGVLSCSLEEAVAMTLFLKTLYQGDKIFCEC